MLALVVAVVLAGLASGATWWVQHQGYTQFYGDAQAHLNIARRVLDSRTPGVLQIGTVWLPLPHLMMMPLAGNDILWENGLAGAIPVSACFWLGGVLFYLALVRIFHSRWAALGGISALALNPNLLYLQATPMTEAIFVAALAGVLYGCTRFAERPGFLWATFSGVFALAGAMTRYDGWFLLPFIALFLLWKGGTRRWFYTVVFCLVAGAGPVWWLAHNWWFWGDALEFYRGPYSAKAIYQRQLASGMSPYPGDGNWLEASRYFLTAAYLVAGSSLFLLGLAGVVLGFIRGPRWGALLLLIPGVFYVVSIHNAGTPIFVPDLWPNAHYNTRYGMALLPALCFGIGMIVSTMRPTWRPWGAMIALTLVSVPWALHPGPDGWVCWKESDLNSRARRQWLGETATYLKRMYAPGSGILLSFGDLTGVLQLSGIPLRDSLHEGNHPLFRGAANSPEYFFREEWALCHSGDDVARAMVRAQNSGIAVRKVREIRVGNALPVEIWRRSSEFGGIDLSRPERIPPPLRGMHLPGLARRDWGTGSDGQTEDGITGEEDADGDSIH